MDTIIITNDRGYDSIIMKLGCRSDLFELLKELNNDFYKNIVPYNLCEELIDCINTYFNTSTNFDHCVNMSELIYELEKIKIFKCPNITFEISELLIEEVF